MAVNFNKAFEALRRLLSVVTDDVSAAELLDVDIEDVRNWRVALDLGPVDIELEQDDGPISATIAAGPVEAVIADIDDDGDHDVTVRWRWDGRKRVPATPGRVSPTFERARKRRKGKGLWAKLRKRKAG